MEFLKREGLYSPQMKDMRVDDPVATDLIGALLTVRSSLFCVFSFDSFQLNRSFNPARTIEYNIIATQFKRFGCAIDKSTKFHFVGNETEGKFDHQQFTTKLP